MAGFLYAFYAAVFAGLLIYNVFVYRKTRRFTTLLIAFNAIGLIWEDGVIASGNMLGPGELLKALNYGRYLLHFIVVPLLTWVFFEQLRLAGQAWAASRLVRGMALGLIAVLLFMGLVLGLDGLYPALKPEVEEGVLRYYAPSLQAALVPIVMMCIALISGLLLWVKNKWPWLFLSTLLVFITEGALQASSLGLLVGNATEVLFQIALLQTELFVTPKHPSA